MAAARWHTLKCDAVCWRLLKNPAKAIECLVEAIELTEQTADLARQTGTMLNYLADLYLQEGRLAEAEAAIRRSLSIHLSGPDSHKELAAGDRMILARVLSRQGRHREAYDAGRQALAFFRKQLGKRNSHVVQTAETVQEFKRKKDAEPDQISVRIEVDTID